MPHLMDRQTCLIGRLMDLMNLQSTRDKAGSLATAASLLIYQISPSRREGFWEEKKVISQILKRGFPKNAAGSPNPSKTLASSQTSHRDWVYFSALIHRQTGLKH